MTSGLTNVTGSNNTVLGYLADVALGDLANATAVGNRAAVGASNSLVLGSINGVNFCTLANNCDSVNVGIGTTTPSDRLHVNGIVRVDILGNSGSASLCQNANNQISACSSSLRYKNKVDPFRLGLELIARLKPITFDWKDGGMHDLGLGAEDVAAIEPLLVTYNKDGQVEGVKYDRIGVVLVNAVKEQQQTIERQQKQIDALKALVCASNREAGFCKELN